MRKYNTFKNQIVSGTETDGHGEKRPKEFFEELILNMPKRIPLGQQHDMAKKTVGYMEKFKLIPHTSLKDEWHLIADVYITTNNINEALKGFSYSTLETIGGNTTNPLYYIHIPYPMYNDKKLIQELIESDNELLVGKWVKKALDPVTIGLMSTGLVLLIAPEWDIQYKTKIRPALERLFKFIPKLLENGISPDLIQHIRGNLDEEIQLYFVPDRDNVIKSYNEELIFNAMNDVRDYLYNDTKSHTIGVQRVKFYLDTITNKYMLFHIQYLDGTDINIV
jgi:hypothetical protein